MLVNLNDVLIPARNNKYAVGLFNTVNLEMARGVLAAAEARQAPVIIGTAEVLVPCTPLEELADFLIPMAKRAGVPVVVHFDHGLTFEKCMEALKLGFTSIMYDCSTDSYDENIRKVKELTRIAHCFGATVEGELGHVGDNEGSAEGHSAPEASDAATVDYTQAVAAASGEHSASAGGDFAVSDPTAYYTQPEQARDYVEKTGVDALAIAVGTAHGAYKVKPQLDFERIAEIRKIVDIPLVLHGGSGLSDEDFRKTIANGISKVNIFTDLNAAASEAVKEAQLMGKAVMTDIIPYQIEAIRKAAEMKMELFGSGNQIRVSSKTRGQS
ncbi:MAG: class II fructose-bisphosphate aldolase [Clostridiales Family XIII bacterium]|jgi:fructose-bisphosphate aldolase class II|nr:class II fructose-bisphosphate aldolase [Clostridiales Family XIII bacterium]